MNAKKLKAYAVKQGNMLLTRQHGMQWLVAGRGMYPLRGWPEMNAEELLAVLEIPEEKRAGHQVQALIDDAGGYGELAQPMQDGESYDVQLGGLIISQSGGGSFIPAYTPEGLKFISAAALAPVADEAAKQQMIYRRNGGAGVIAIMEGMLVAGVVSCQTGWLDGRTVDELQDVASAAQRIDREKRAAELNADKQMKMEELEQ